MKKLLIMVAILAVVMTSALATSIDISTLTIDELVVLRGEIDAVLNEEIFPIYAGKYIVGVDILPGRYTIKCLTAKEGKTGMLITVENEAGEDVHWINCEIGEERFVTIEEGQMLQLSSGGGTIKKVDPFWML